MLSTLASAIVEVQLLPNHSLLVALTDGFKVDEVVEDDSITISTIFHPDVLLLVFAQTTPFLPHQTRPTREETLITQRTSRGQRLMLMTVNLYQFMPGFIISCFPKTPQ
jgi:hypothetical protein